MDTAEVLLKLLVLKFTHSGLSSCWPVVPLTRGLILLLTCGLPYTRAHEVEHLTQENNWKWNLIR